MPGWLAMIIYTTPDDSVDDIWTKKGLISVRNFEARAKGDPNFKKSCVANPAPDGAVDIVFCNNAASWNSPLSLFPNPNNLENMTEFEIKKVLTDTIANPVLWNKGYAPFFGNEVTLTNPKVKYMRAISNHAGPIKDGTKRYENINDEKSEQAKIVTEFQKSMRDWSEDGEVQFEGVKVKIFGGLLIGVYF